MTEPVVSRARLLGLGSKLYPSTKQPMLNKDHTRFMQGLSQVHQKNKVTKLQDNVNSTHRARGDAD